MKSNQIEIFSELMQVYGDGKCEIFEPSEKDLEAVGWIIPDLKDHPNVMFVKAKIPKINYSNINNDVLTIDGVKDRLKRMLLQPINLANGLKRHNTTRPIGVVYDSTIDNEDLVISGIIWKKYFPREAKIIEENKSLLGISWEISGSEDGWKYIEASSKSKKNRYRVIESNYDFTGFSILLTDVAAYSDSSIEEIIAQKEGGEKMEITAQELEKLEDEKKELEKECKRLEEENKKLAEEKKALEDELATEREKILAERKHFLGKERFALYSSKILVDDAEKDNLLKMFAEITEEQFATLMANIEKAKTSKDGKIVVSSSAKMTAGELSDKFFGRLLK